MRVMAMDAQNDAPLQEPLALPPSPRREDFVAAARATLLSLATRGGGPRSTTHRRELMRTFRSRVPEFEPKDVDLWTVVSGFQVLAGLGLSVGLFVFTMRTQVWMITAAPLLWAVAEARRRALQPGLDRQRYRSDCEGIEALYLTQASDVPPVVRGKRPHGKAALLQTGPKHSLVRLSAGASLPATATCAVLGRGDPRVALSLALRTSSEDTPWATLHVRAPYKIQSDEVVVVTLELGVDGRVAIADATVVGRGAPLDAWFEDEDVRFPV